MVYGIGQKGHFVGVATYVLVATFLLYYFFWVFCCLLGGRREKGSLLAVVEYRVMAKIEERLFLFVLFLAYFSLLSHSLFFFFLLINYFPCRSFGTQIVGFAF
jgi:hypothetical protein